MKKFLILLFCLIPLASQANDKEIKSVMNKYLKSLHHFDAKLLKSIASARYFKRLEPTIKAKKLKHTGKFIPYNFNISIKKALINPNQFWVKIKSKTDKDFDHYVYIVEKHDQKFVITNYFEEGH